MALIKICINRFHLGSRIVLRNSVELPEIEVAAVNDPFNAFIKLRYAEYMLKHEPSRSAFKGGVSNNGKGPTMNGKKAGLFTQHDPAKILWSDETGIKFISKSPGIFTTTKKASAHLSGSAKHIIVSAPSADAPIFVMGVHHEKYNNKPRIISNTPYATNYLNPLAKQSGRDTAQNIFHGVTGAAKAVGKVISELSAKLIGMAMHISTANVSVFDLTVRLEKGASDDHIKTTVKAAAEGELKSILAYIEDDVVSSGLNGNPNSFILDAKAGISLNENFVRVVSWYDNEWGYSRRVLDLLAHVAKVDAAN